MISSFSGKLGNCINVERSGKYVVLNETDYPHQMPLMTNPKSFAAFIQGVKEGEFDEIVEVELERLKASPEAAKEI